MLFALKKVTDEVDKVANNFFSSLTKVLKILLVKGSNLRKEKSDFFSIIAPISL